MENYKSVAKSIINDTIRSAIYIDDEISSLFCNSPDENKRCQELYESFREQNCSLDFFKYENDNGWKDKKKLIFSRKNLLILDWELDTNGIKYASTLEIIDEAVKTDNLHFVCIYTNTPSNDVGNIFYEILAYYSGNTNEDESQEENLIALLENAGEDSDDIFIKLKPILKNLSINPLPENYSEVKKQLGIIFDKKMNGEFRKFLKNNLPQNRSFCSLSRLGFILNKNNTTKYTGKLPYIKCSETDNYLQINNTIFSIFEKRVIQPDKLYEKFSDSIISASENFLTLLSLELKNKILDNSSFIGKDLSEINESAFFHHMDTCKNNEVEGDFNEFLIELWKSYNTNALYSGNIALFSVLDDYKNKRNIQCVGSSDNDLIKLNYYYNFQYTIGNGGRGIGFGDIFLPKDQNFYLLCITPHCDCLHPDNINGNYYFVKGRKYNSARSLEEAENEFLSYIKNETNEIIPIIWERKPFTIHISKPNKISSLGTVYIESKAHKDLVYTGSIKENYAQRIANQAFSNPMRVGITFVKKTSDKKVTKCKCCANQ